MDKSFASVALPHLLAVLEYFQVTGKAELVEPHGTGHIHDTYKVTMRHALQPEYLLQRINHHVFRRVPEMMANIRRVTEHLRTTISPSSLTTLTLVQTVDGKDYYLDAEGQYWRVYTFIPNAQGYDLVTTPEQAYQGGRAFGWFDAQMADLPGAPLIETIPDFHNIETRLVTFRDALAANAAGRLDEVRKEVDFVLARAEAMPAINRLGRAGKIPLRITHNDTKFNNVLLDSTGKAVCVVDLDTVMPGYLAYDFGDSIRTIVNTAAEDEKDLRKIGVNMDFLEAYAQGFLAEMNQELNPFEVESLTLGCTLLPYLMGVRFLTDYLSGDPYYKIGYPEHNRDRARAQFRLIECLETRLPEIRRIIRQYATRD